MKQETPTAGDGISEELANYLEDIRDAHFSFLNYDHISINTRGITGDTPLKIAVVRGDYDICKEMLECGADPNVQGEDGFTPLHYAARRDKKIGQLLRNFGASDDIKNDFGDTPADLEKRRSR